MKMGNSEHIKEEDKYNRVARHIEVSLILLIYKYYFL